MATSGAAPDHRSRLFIALAGSLVLHALLLAYPRSMSRVAFDIATRQQPLAVELAQPKPLAATFAATRRDNQGASPAAAAPDTAPSPAQSQPAFPLEANQGTPLPATESPRFSLDALRQQVRVQAQREREAQTIAPQNLGQVVPPPILERDTPFTQPIAKALRPDCRTAHAGWGLFSIPLLIYDSATDKGCKW